ncbi:hypothetical protein GCG21_11945 [Pseudactinotalea sp. HY160]|uniref:stealth family protein n=1 Tax=Pseudactinotalea sp. HY160 TaxID=2654490 RepID=UPI00128B5466|nr:stealth family protein [Pseudactinotalea sp. HY160]MPV50704.1 hypothetical protein [Pseudactinotalea sp. HY160]
MTRTAGDVGQLTSRIGRVLAKVYRGDMHRWARERVWAAMPTRRPGFLRHGPLLRPRLARVVDDVDRHRLRAEGLETIVVALGDLVDSVVPDQPHMPRQVTVPVQDRAGALSALSSLPPHWRRDVSDHERLVTMTPGYASAAGPISRESDLDIDVIFTENRTSPQVLQPTAPCHADVDGVIDLVYTWVDGSDHRWRERRQRALRSVTDTRPSAPETAASHHPNAIDDARFADTDELRFSLRSVAEFANWVRRIYIVTDSQVPEWLDVNHPRIVLVDHHDILPGSVFNSHAIESALHRIPGLAERYLYLNDDVFFGRIAYPTDFFRSNTMARYFPSDLPVPAGPVEVDDPPIMAAAKNGRDIISDRFGTTITTKVRHTVHPQLRSVIEQMEREYPEQFARVGRSLFRSDTDISVASSLHHWYASALGKAVPSDVDYLYLNITDRGAGQVLDALASLRRYSTFCLNQEDSTPGIRCARADLRRFLERYFPVPAPWEKGDR